MKKRKWAAILAGGLLLGSLSGCFGGGNTLAPTPSQTVSLSPSAALSQEIDRPEVRLALAGGPTYMGTLCLLEQDRAGESENTYALTRCDSSDEAAYALKYGEADIAALEVTQAIQLYHETQGGVCLLAVTARGGLTLMQNGGEPVGGLADLAGREVYAVGECAAAGYVFLTLLNEQGLAPGGDVTLQWGDTDEGIRRLSGGESELVLLAFPADCVAEGAGAGERALSLAEEWTLAGLEGEPLLECLAVRSDFAQEHPERVSAFLAEYENSADYMTDPEKLARSDEGDPARLVEAALGSAAGAEELGEVLCFIQEEKALRNAVQSFCESLYAVDPAALGGSIPDDEFYFR